MSLKYVELGKILEKAKIIAKVWQIHSSKFIWQAPCHEVLSSFDFAPLIATICDEEINAEDAWSFPSWLYSTVGIRDLNNVNSLLSLEHRYRELLEEYLRDRWPQDKGEYRKRRYIEKISNSIVNALRYFKDLEKTPITMFDDRKYNVSEVYFLFRAIPGIGPKKAFMIVRDFVYRVLGYTKCHPWFDQVKGERSNFELTDVQFLDPPIDVHAVKVFSRLFGRVHPSTGSDWKIEITPEIVQDIHMFARLAFPDLPAKIDDLFWNIGRKYCYRDKPNCIKCPLREACDTAAKRVLQRY
jgi:endonuclease III